MVMLQRSDIQTEEVLSWQGLHLLHFIGSSCSQKTRIFLKLKGIPCELHHVNLAEGEQYSDWFMGINPRGLVPVLVDDGQVIIESNDILLYLEEKFPSPALIPDAQNAEAEALLVAEDKLHLDLRTLSLRFVFPPERTVRGEDALALYEAKGSGTVQGESDPHKAVELAFFREIIKNNGISDEQALSAIHNFKAAYDDLERRLSQSDYLLGDALSVIDIAWYIYSARLLAAGYPLQALHPAVAAWYAKLDARPEFSEEVMLPPLPPRPGPSLSELAGFTA
ncbi:MAG: glutathione S-transferase family protein [Pseudomonadota bacterium]